MMVLCRWCDVAWSTNYSDHCFLCGRIWTVQYRRLSDAPGVHHVTMQTVEWGKVDA